MGAVNSALAGGNLGDVLRGAAVGAVQGAISAGPLHYLESVRGMELAHVVGHGVTGGAANEAMGGKFQDGFLSAAAGAAAVHTGLTSAAQGSRGEAIGMAGRTAASAVIGGTASVLGGGKFANGAWTAAFQHLLNTESLDQLGKWAQDIKYAWTSAQMKNKIDFYRKSGLNYTNQSIDDMKKTMFVDDSARKMLGSGAISQTEYERINANNYQTYLAANLAAASMDPSWKFAPNIVVSGAIGGAIIYGGQVGFAADTNSVKLFYGHGPGFGGFIASIGAGLGYAPSVGTKTTSYNMALPIGLGGGYENGGWNFQLSTPGANKMNNTYYAEFK